MYQICWTVSFRIHLRWLHTVLYVSYLLNSIIGIHLRLWLHTVSDLLKSIVRIHLRYIDLTYGVVCIRSVEQYRLDTFEIWLHTVLYVSYLLNSIIGIHLRLWLHTVLYVSDLLNSIVKIHLRVGYIRCCMYQICWTVSLGYIWDLVTYGVVCIRSVEQYHWIHLRLWLHTVLYVSDLLNSIVRIHLRLYYIRCCMYHICWTVSLGYIWDLVTYGVVCIRSVEQYR